MTKENIPDLSVLEQKMQKHLGLSFSDIVLPDEEITCISYEDSLLFGTLSAHKKPYLVQGDIYDFLESAPEGYFLIGHWGHGVNSYAYYYQRVDSWSKIFFRLGYGGVYSDVEKEAKAIREFLPGYFKIEKELRKIASRIVFVDSMDEGNYKVYREDKKIFEIKASLFHKAYFGELDLEKEFKSILSARQR